MCNIKCVLLASKRTGKSLREHCNEASTKFSALNKTYHSHVVIKAWQESFFAPDARRAGGRSLHHRYRVGLRVAAQPSLLQVVRCFRRHIAWPWRGARALAAPRRGRRPSARAERAGSARSSAVVRAARAVQEPAVHGRAPRVRST